MTEIVIKLEHASRTSAKIEVDRTTQPPQGWKWLTPPELSNDRCYVDKRSASVIDMPTAPPMYESPPVVLRATELAWIRTHQRELASYEGQWVVIEGAELVAHGVDFTAVVRQARQRGVSIPFVVKIPSQPEKPFIL